MKTETLKRIGLIVVGLAVAYGAGLAVGLARGKVTPISVTVQGLVFASLNALFAMGLVLVYRANRVINFSHAAFGVPAIVVFATFYDRVGYFPALILGVAAAAVVGAGAEIFLVRRFSKSPRLVLTVATLGIFQLVGGASALVLGPLLLRFVVGEDAAEDGLGNFQLQPRSPFTRFRFDWFPVQFSGDYIVIVVVSLVVMVAMAAFFRYTSIGIAVRGASENDDRASLLGINTKNLSTFVWILAAVLAAVSALLLLPVQGFSGAAAVGSLGGSLRTMLRALAAAILGRMENMPVTVAAAFGIAMFEQSVFWAFDDTSLVNVALLLVIVVTMLIQRGKLARVEESQTSTWSATEEVRGIPKELATFPPVRRTVRRAAVLGLVGVLAYPWIASPSQTNLGSVYAIYGIVAISLVILTGWGGQISLGQFAFVAVGGIVGASITTNLGWHFLIALPIAAVVGAVVAILLGLPALRIRGLYLAVTTLAFSVAVSTVVLNPRYFGWLLPETNVKRPVFLFIDTEDERAYYYFTLVVLALALLAVEGMRRSRTGRVLIAMRDNERSAESFGISLVRVRLATFAISGFIAAVAGVMFAHHQHAVDAQAFSPEQSITIFLMAVIGGLGSVRGVLLGALYFGTVTIFVSGLAGQALANSVGVLLVLLFIPTGLGGVVYRLRDAWLRRVAVRYRIVVPSLVGDYRIGTGEFAKAPLAPKFGSGDEKIVIPVRYRLPSRIGIAGSSQKQTHWRF